MAEAIIVDAMRTAVGKSFRGSFVDTRSDDLGGAVIAELLRRNPGLDPATVADVYWGCSLPVHSQAYNIARQVGLLGGLPDIVPATTMSRSCGSAFTSIRCAVHALQAGDGDVYLAGGSDSFSMCYGRAFGAEDQNPRFTDEARSDFINHAYMAVFDTAEIVAEKCGIGRAEMDAFAKLSHDRALAARRAGYFTAEILPVRNGSGAVVSDDDSPRETSLEVLGKLRPIAPELGGRITAGNTCVAGDGAAAVVLTSARHARERGLARRGRIVASTVAGCAPELMGLGWIPATRSLLEKLGMAVADIGVFEVHENFAAQIIPGCRELGIDMDGQLNPHGGALAIGHPPGMTGARLVATALHGLETRDQQFAVVAACVAGGMGIAILIERLA